MELKECRIAIAMLVEKSELSRVREGQTSDDFGTEMTVNLRRHLDVNVVAPGGRKHMKLDLSAGRRGLKMRPLAYHKAKMAERHHKLNSGMYVRNMLVR